MVTIGRRLLLLFLVLHRLLRTVSTFMLQVSIRRPVRTLALMLSQYVVWLLAPSSQMSCPFYLPGHL